jgi:5-methyltetrahydropteroyltriglutamate--homocysteine methyltransferase
VIDNPIGSTVLGYPRIGPRRELKRAVEGYWAGRLNAGELAAAGRELRARAWTELAGSGLASVPGNTFSLYDQVLDTAVMVDAVPPRFRALGLPPLETYFAMARGREGRDVAAPLEMTKWFDTNYHYIVPELGPGTVFTPGGERAGERDAKPVAEYREAAALGVETRPVLLGPVTFLLLSKPAPGAPAGFAPLDLLDPLLECYAEVLRRLAAAGCAWVQLDEPAFAADRTGAELAALRRAYDRLAALAARPRLLVAGYFGDLGPALPVLADSAVEAIAVDLVAGPEAAGRIPSLPGLRGKTLVAGVVDGRNVWRADLPAAAATCASLLGSVGSLAVSTSCSLLHVPYDLGAETGLDPRLRERLAFARQKVAEVVMLGEALRAHDPAVTGRLAAAGEAGAPRRPGPGPDRGAAAGPPAARPVRRAGPCAGGAAGAAAAGDHDHRLVPADRRGAPGPGRAARGAAGRGGLHAAYAGRDRAGDRASGTPRPGRAGARRARAQRHGAVLRGAPGGLRRHRARLGAVLRFAVRAPADPPRRRGANRPDHRGVERVRPVADEPSGEGHADRAGDAARLVLRP